MALLDECLLTAEEMAARTASAVADVGGDPPAESWWVTVPGVSQFPAWEGSEAAALSAEANAEVLQAKAFDALMEAQETKDNPGAAAAAAQAQARAAAAKAR